MNSGIDSANSSQLTADHSRLKTVTFDSNNMPSDEILAMLKQDYVVLLSDVSATSADALMAQICEKLRLKEALELQAAFASSLGNRRNVGQYYMSVEQRGEYHIVPPHCEGSSFANIQLASFYCFENTTDGGETTLFNLNQQSEGWSQLKEQLTRAKYVGTPSAAEISKARVMYRLNLEQDYLRQTDVVLQEQQMSDKLWLYAVLAEPVRRYCDISQREIFSLWDSITGPDHDAIEFMAAFLKDKGCLKLPDSSADLSQYISKIDWSPDRRQIHTGTDYAGLFSRYIHHKLKPGEFMIYNNFSWAHSVNNWTPGSGVRNVAAAFA